jgi:hypothetical protein
MKQITVAMVGNTNHKLMEYSLANTIKNTPYVTDVLVFSDKPVIANSKHHFIPPEFDKNDYNTFLIKDLNNHINTEFVLICQYDGMAINSNCWTDEFLNYDYIGAPWPVEFSWIPESQRVGNGGFSLRSKRLLEALQDTKIVVNENEDVVICQTYKSLLETKYNINYSPIDLANRFSNEWNNPDGDVFGFHGIFNIPRYFSDEQCAGMIALYASKNWYPDQLVNFLKYCEQNNYIKTLLELEKLLTSHS